MRTLLPRTRPSSLLPLCGLLLLCAAGAGCGDDNKEPVRPDIAMAPRDLAMEPDADNAVCDETKPCVGSDHCYHNACVPDRGACNSDGGACESDTRCVCADGKSALATGCAAICVGWPDGGTDPKCKTPAIAPGALMAPQLKCAWGTSNNITLSTPIVADLDGDGLPEITVMSFETGFTSIHGKDCSVYFDKTFAFSGSNQGTLAVADLDGDGKPEIIGIAGPTAVPDGGVDPTGNHVVVFDNKGELLATSPTALLLSPSVEAMWAGVSVADLDGDGKPEIVAGAQVLQYSPTGGSGGTPMLKVLWTATALGPGFGPMSIVADIDEDGKPDVITGLQIFEGMPGVATGVEKTPGGLASMRSYNVQGTSSVITAGAYPAIGDFNGDGHPDLALVQSEDGAERVAIYDYFNDKNGGPKQFIMGPYAIADEWGGPPTVADFDGDGVPDFATAGKDHYYVFATKCLKNPKPADCDQTQSNGTLWRKKTQDHSSGSTGSSVFDFNGDGINEVIYRDECWLRVYNGPDGKTLFAAAVTSATALELPVVADVDGDGHVDIVVSSDDDYERDSGTGCVGPPTVDGGAATGEPNEEDTNTVWSGATHGILIFSDPAKQWMPSRAVWNQHSYHVTNVNDDLTVPAKEKNSWVGPDGPNTYRANRQESSLSPLVLPDATANGKASLLSGHNDCKSVWHLRANICDRGIDVIPAGMPGTFYQSDPTSGTPQPICTGVTTGVTQPGQCSEVDCDWLTPSVFVGYDPEHTRVDIWFRANDPGMTMPAATYKECNADNDVLLIANAFCGVLL